MKIKATIKEKSDRIVTPTYIISKEEYEKLPEDFFIKFWGLDDSDVIWYKLEVIDEDNN